MRRISVVLADDHHVVREGVRAVLEAAGDCRVIGEEADGHKVVDLVASARPDVLLLDLAFPGVSGIDIAREVVRRVPRTRIVMFSIHGEESHVKAALLAGVVGYVVKGAASSEVLSAIRHVAKGGGRYYFSPPLADRAFAAYATHTRTDFPNHDALTRRERQVLQLVLGGDSNIVAGARLGISSRTVESHRASLMRKLGVRNTTELLRYAVRAGLIPRN